MFCITEFAVYTQVKLNNLSGDVNLKRKKKNCSRFSVVTWMWCYFPPSSLLIFLNNILFGLFVLRPQKNKTNKHESLILCNSFCFTLTKYLSRCVTLFYRKATFKDLHILIFVVALCEPLLPRHILKQETMLCPAPNLYIHNSIFHRF